MKQYKVTLNMTFTPCFSDVNDIDEDDDPILLTKEDGEEETEEEAHERKKKAFERTQAYYDEHDVIEYIKGCSASSFIEELYPVDMEIVSAEWTPGKYQIQMVVNTDLKTAEEVEESLRNESLEDGIYETTGDSGWQIWTRDPNGDGVGKHGWNLDDFWVYGESDYRRNEIVVEEM